LLAFLVVFSTQTSWAVDITSRKIDDALFQAVKYQSGIDQIEVLLLQGASPDAEALVNMDNIKAGENIWIYALEYSNPETIALLTRYRKTNLLPAKKLQARAFETVIYTSQSENPTYAIERVKLLIEQGFDVNAVDPQDIQSDGHRPEEGLSPLMMAVMKGRAELVEILLKNGADIGIKTIHGKTALCFARQAGIVEQLIAAGAQLQDRESGHWRAIFEAANLGDADTIRILVDHGMPVDIRDENDTTALMVASGRGHLDVIRALVDRKADLEAVNSNRPPAATGNEIIGTPLMWAKHHQQTAAFDLLVSLGAKQNESQSASEIPPGR
jgi:ankyrin repeat protein